MARYGLIFDVDGVIADTEAANAAASIKVFEDLFGITGVKRADFEAGLGRGAFEYVKAAADVHGLSLTASQLEAATAMRQNYFLERLKTHPLDAFEGVPELIEASLADPDVEVAIATSGTREKSLAVLISASVPYEKMVYVNGDDVTEKKPDPQLFLIAAERMNIAPCRCVVIEDAPNGVMAAKAAGAKCIAVTNSTAAEKLDQADVICDSLKEVDIDIIKRLADKANE